MDFKNYLEEQGKSINTIEGYILHINNYFKWFENSFGEKCERLYRQNILEYKSYLKNVAKVSSKTINAKLAALLRYNQFLIDSDIQTDLVVNRTDNVRVQQQFASPATIGVKDVEQFRQKILQSESSRFYSMVTIMAYGGLRISETLNLRTFDINLTTREIKVVNGKGDKERLVYINDKIIAAVSEYLKERSVTNSDYLFVSNRNNKIDRTVINKLFKKYSKNITPHVLRHFYCSHCLECGYAVHEVANQAGHSNIHTTLLYSNPSRQAMKEKANLL